MPLDVSRPITRRQFPIDYISPLVCDELFSGSSEPIISILPFDELLFPSGLLISGTGPYILTWNAVNRAICYNVYRALALGGPYQLVSTCQSTRQYSDDPGDGTFFYRVSAITPEGETPLSPEVSTDPGIVDPGECSLPACPPEEGVANFGGEQTTWEEVGTVEVSIDGSEVKSFGTQESEVYRVVYVSDNVEFSGSPGAWGILAAFDVTPGASSPVEVSFERFGDSPGAGTLGTITDGQEFSHPGGEITVTGPIGGNPDFSGTGTWKLEKRILPPPWPIPDRVRIACWEMVEFDPCEECPTFENLPDWEDPTTEWDGTFPVSQLLPTALYRAEPLGLLSLTYQGRVIIARIQHNTQATDEREDDTLVLQIYCLDVDYNDVLIWEGTRSVGDNFPGLYYRTGGCSATPECLEIEEY